MTQLATSSDHLLKNAIEKELEWAPDVTADHIGVGVTDGTVTLSGQVTTYPEKKAAVAATLRVRGVTAVADEILVQHHFGHLEDSDIAREASTILRAASCCPTTA
jgi:osmotically-inducible protein OsmY